LNETTLNIKDAMSCFTTGVTVVTTHTQGQDWGMTCNSFNTVSLDPAMVLWSVRRQSFSHGAFASAGVYLVNVLAAHQEDLALRFASGSQQERFEGLDLVRSVSQLPRLPDVLAWFACKTVRVVEAGDHDILIGEVVDFGSQAGHGLAYAQRRFGVMAALDE
jgi:3-hydroxy-9,10-secoandrosta-1,3,5(10)-triene-9,17-dione monooxygenase reductase component